MRLASVVLITSLVATPLHAQRAGQLISADPIVETPGGMQAWKVSYWTTTDRGRPIKVTGIVAAPREAIPRDPRRVLAWTHGAWGVASKCAPSLSPNFWTMTAGLNAVQRGYVVVAPDYAGLGSEGVHPFLIGQDTARAVLDGVRASRQIPGAAAGRRYAVWGESQGGHASLWTGQLSRGYAPDVTLVGTAAAAPPTTLLENLRLVPNKTIRAFFLAYIGHSWSNHYGAPLSTFGGPQTRGIITRLAQNNCIQFESKPKLGTTLGILTLQSRVRNLDLSRVQPWATLARRNTPTTTNFGVPLLIAQNAKDDLVAPSVTRAHARALCRTNARVRWIDIVGQSHMTSAKDTTKATLDWIDDRFDGKRAPSDCGKF